MKVSLEKKGQNVVSLAVEIEADRAQKAYDQACRQLSQKVNIPGFRKGKAPKNVIEKTLGPDYIKRETLEHLIPQLIGSAITEKELDVITEPEVDSLNFELGQPLSFTAQFEVRPEVTLGNYKGVSVEVGEATMKDEALETVLKQLAESKATLKEIPDRKIAMGDTVIIDFECHYDGKPIEGGKAEGLMLEMGEGNFFEGFCEQLAGAEPNKEKDVNVTFPENYRNKDLAGKAAIFKVTVKGLREKTLPDINDELAKAIGMESLDKLKEAINERLTAEVKEENDARAQKAVVEKVVEGAKVDLPDTMVERETNMLVQQNRQALERAGQSWEEFEKSDGFKTMKDEKDKEARQRIATSLVLGAIVRAEKLIVEDKDLYPHFAELAQMYNVPLEKVVNNAEIRRKVMEETLASKVVEFLMNSAEIKYVAEKESDKQKVLAK